MKNALPSSVKIAGYDVKVQLVKNELDEQNANGSYHNQIIKINPGIGIQEQQSTLVHEVLECIVSVYRIQSLSEHHGDLAILSEALYQVLVDNPGLLSPDKQRWRS